MSAAPAETGQPRALAARLVWRVLDHGESLAESLPAAAAAFREPRQRALLRELVQGTLRHVFRLEFMLGRLLERPLRARDRDLHALLLTGLYQLMETDMAEHAAVSETVALARRGARKWAPGLVNAVLRNALRQREALRRAADAGPVSRYSLPRWWLDRLAADWPEDWQSVARASGRRPPMVLRVNRLRGTRDHYLRRLADAGIDARAHPLIESAVELDKPVPVDRLPGFGAGDVSVQDAAAQLAAGLLAPRAGQRVLDACAAPGGKTGHLLESVPGIELLALDRDARRLERVGENLARLGLRAALRCADAAEPGAWWDGRPFERILLDAPCSATGVVRRHPDIRVLRRAGDIDELRRLQQRLLAALWPLLAPGGILLYATCSIFRAENEEVVETFLAGHDSARSAARVPSAGMGRCPGVGWQLLTGERGADGFFYAALKKDSDTGS